jgi:tetratricopeptide (TPR) repeat protein
MNLPGQGGYQFPNRLVSALLCVALAFGACSRPPQPPGVPALALDPQLATLIATSRQAVVVAPKSAEAWGRLGQAFHAADLFAEARLCYGKAEEMDPHQGCWPHLLGLLQLQDQPEASLTNLARAAELAGVQTDAPRLRLAQALVERGRIDEAARHLELLLAANPAHPAARLEMARVLLARNELERAAESLAPCATNAYTARPALQLLSQIRQRQGDGASASALARRAASMPRPIDWPDPWLREMLGRRADRQKLQDQANGLLIQQRLKEAEDALAKLLRAFPDDPEGLLLLGRLRFQQRRCAEAEETLRRHLALQPASLHGSFQLGLALLCQQRWDDAAAALRAAIALKPDFAQAHYNLGYALSGAGNTTGAIASYREALRSRPGDAETHLALAEELHRAGQVAEALEHLGRSAELNPNDPRVTQLRERIEKR